MLCLSIVPRCAPDRQVVMNAPSNGSGETAKSRIRLISDFQVPHQNARFRLGSCHWCLAARMTELLLNSWKASPRRERPTIKHPLGAFLMGTASVLLEVGYD